MKKPALIALVGLLSLPVFTAAQTTPPPIPGQAPAQAAPPAPGTNALVDYTRQIKYDGLNLSVLLVNNRTVEVLFQAPAKYSMRARANQQTVLYIQGTPSKEFDLNNAFTIEQDGQTLTGTSTSIKNFVNGKVAAGQRIDGLVEFPKKVDISKPFTVKNGTTGSVQFVLTPEAIKALAPPPTPGSR
jgi:hypothetical protein